MQALSAFGLAAPSADLSVVARPLQPAVREECY